eukprot:TRINITY_DN974_c0_g1_i1.p1 TRINITY_DN974_c0_g1~~TRINITY_DN974_c0_g1_i1.p1  ORF type:complete len:388 (+),score=102.37 TRINITY_DN974_c0_g1_i1:2038-3201(+)
MQVETEVTGVGSARSAFEVKDRKRSREKWCGYDGDDEMEAKGVPTDRLVDNNGVSAEIVDVNALQTKIRRLDVYLGHGDTRYREIEIEKETLDSDSDDEDDEDEDDDDDSGDSVNGVGVDMRGGGVAGLLDDEGKGWDKEVVAVKKQNSGWSLTTRKALERVGMNPESMWSSHINTSQCSSSTGNETTLKTSGMSAGDEDIDDLQTHQLPVHKETTVHRYLSSVMEQGLANLGESTLRMSASMVMTPYHPEGLVTAWLCMHGRDAQPTAIQVPSDWNECLTVLGATMHTSTVQTVCVADKRSPVQTHLVFTTVPKRQCVHQVISRAYREGHYGPMCVIVQTKQPEQESLGLSTVTLQDLDVMALPMDACTWFDRKTNLLLKKVNGNN